MYFEHSVIFACLCHHSMRFYRLVLTAGLLVQMYLKNLIDFVFGGCKDNTERSNGNCSHNDGHNYRMDRLLQ